MFKLETTVSDPVDTNYGIPSIKKDLVSAIINLNRFIRPENCSQASSLWRVTNRPYPKESPTSTGKMPPRACVGESVVKLTTPSTYSGIEFISEVPHDGRHRNLLRSDGEIE